MLTAQSSLVMKQLMFLFVLLCLFGAVVPQTPLRVVALVPTGNDNASRCVDRGEELVVAANISLEAINANNSILKDYELSIVVARSDNCTEEAFSTALVQFAKSTLADEGAGVVGVIGMVCPSTVQHISPFVSLPGISLLQITAGTTPPRAITRSRDRVKIGNLYQTAPAATTYNDALIALMKEQNWTKIAVVRLTSALNIIHNNQFADLQAKFNGTNMSITFNGEVTTGEDDSTFGLLLDEIERRRSRIIYASLPEQETRNFLCQAYLKNISSPLYTWVLYDHPLETLTKRTDRCSAAMMTEMLTGAILLHYDVTTNRNRTVEPWNLRYDEYETRYKEQLQTKFGNDTRCGRGHEIIYSNAMYDSVIAIALALNQSQAEVNLTEYGKGMPNSTKELDRSLIMGVKFDGAMGRVSFDNATHELKMRIGVDIYRISNSILLPYAYYNGTSNTIRRLENYSSEISDTFDTDFKRVHIALTASILVVVGILVTISVIVLVLFIFHWNAPDIRATSPKLSIIILVACFLLYASALFTAVRSSFSSGELFAALCTLEWWTFVISIQLIFATLFMRLLRVYRIFFHYEKAGKPWTDGVILVAIALMVSLSIVLLIVWTGVDTLKTQETSVFVLSPHRPRMDVYLFCRSRYLGAWLGLILGYSGLVMVAVVALAVMTRKIKIEMFRDTKEVNAFIFTMVFLIIVFIPLSEILEGASDASLYTTFILRELCLLLVPIACNIFLFAPKLYYAHFEDSTRHKQSFATDGKNTQSGTKHGRSISGTV